MVSWTIQTLYSCCGVQWIDINVPLTHQGGDNPEIEVHWQPNSAPACGNFYIFHIQDTISVAFTISHWLMSLATLTA